MTDWHFLFSEVYIILQEKNVLMLSERHNCFIRFLPVISFSLQGRIISLKDENNFLTLCLEKIDDRLFSVLLLEIIDALRGNLSYFISHIKNIYIRVHVVSMWLGEL